MVSENSISRSITTKSKSSDIDHIWDWLSSELNSAGFGARDLFAVHLAIEESFINAVQHGNKSDPDKEIRVDCCIDSEKVRISITDQGHGFEPEKVPDPRSRDNIYKARGRGILLIRAYMDQVSFSTRGNSIKMTKYKSSGHNSDTSPPDTHLSQ